MRIAPFATLAAAALLVLTAWPAEAQNRARGQRVQQEAYPGAGYSYRRGPAVRRAPTRITVRRGRTFLDPGTEVLPRSQPDLDYAVPPLWYPHRIYDTTNSVRGPLPDNNFWIPGYMTGW
ncbi:MAG: hypothetical protein IT538_00665 [Variibacter sp.]|nr:hypothetical protein [Variibacter sp.]